MYDHMKTIQFLETQFPEIAEDLHDDLTCELLHPQMSVFARHAQAAIDSENPIIWKRITDAFMCLWRACTPDVENALNVSFLEHLNFKDEKKKRHWAYTKMPVPMRQAFDDMEDYNRKLHGG